MTMQQTRTLQRRGRNSKTGCGTCKIRKIKCDEAQPICMRCSTTGRKCDGYNAPPPPYNVNFANQLATHISGSRAERRGFDFFLRRTAGALEGYYSSSFWDRLLLAAATQHEALRHAVVGIAALHEDFSQRTITSWPTSSFSEGANFASNQYAKAVGALRRSLATEKADTLTTLMTCILLVCHDSMSGRYETAMVHLRNGLRVLHDHRSKQKDHILETCIVPALNRFAVQSIIYIEAKDQWYLQQFATLLLEGIEVENEITSKDFENLQDARNSLYIAAAGRLAAFHSWNEDLPLYMQPVRTVCAYERYTTQLALWNVKYEKYMLVHVQSLNSRELQGAALLKIHYTTAKIMFSTSADPSEISQTAKSTPAALERYDLHLDDFRLIVNLSRSLIMATEQTAPECQTPLCFSGDLGLIGPLYYTCIRCPDESMRTIAMSLLRKSPRKEGMWDSVMIAQMIQQFWDLQTDYPGPPEEFTDNGMVHFAYFGTSPEVAANSSADLRLF